MRAVVEGPADEAVARALIAYTDPQLTFSIDVRGGKSAILDKIQVYNRAAEHIPHLVLVDLDRSHACAPDLVEDWLPTRSHDLHLRVAVPQMESWLLADRDGIAKYLRISMDLVPPYPDQLRNAKETMVHLASKSGSKGIRKDMVSLDHRTGIAYTGRLMEFASGYWSIGRALGQSESLTRCVRALKIAFAR